MAASTLIQGVAAKKKGIVNLICGHNQVGVSTTAIFVSRRIKVDGSNIKASFPRLKAGAQAQANDQQQDQSSMQSQAKFRPNLKPET